MDEQDTRISKNVKDKNYAKVFEGTWTWPWYSHEGRPRLETILWGKSGDGCVEANPRVTQIVIIMCCKGKGLRLSEWCGLNSLARGREQWERRIYTDGELEHEKIYLGKKIIESPLKNFLYICLFSFYIKGGSSWKKTICEKSPQITAPSQRDC